jgi:KaiC/GvpD/RAD55 family RecA-like ATPase
VPRKAAPLPRLLETGITGLDEILGGGLPDGSLILVKGDVGNLHTIFVEQVLYNHVTYRNGKVAYYITDLTSADVQSRMMTFGWRLDDLMSKGAWIFISVHTKDLEELAEMSSKAFQEQFKVSANSTLNGLKSDILHKMKEGRCIVLPISHLRNHFKLQDILDLFLYWRMAVRIYGGIHFAIIDEGAYEKTEEALLSQLTDGLFEFGYREAGMDFTPFMVIRKLRRGLIKPKVVQLSVDGRGIMVETVERIT